MMKILIANNDIPAVASVVGNIFATIPWVECKLARSRAQVFDSLNSEDFKAIVIGDHVKDCLGKTILEYVLKMDNLQVFVYSSDKNFIAEAEGVGVPAIMQGESDILTNKISRIIVYE